VDQRVEVDAGLVETTLYRSDRSGGVRAAHEMAIAIRFFAKRRRRLEAHEVHGGAVPREDQAMSSRVIIEVGLNENQTRAANCHVPYSAEDLADDARRCADAGAAIVHYHARRGTEPALSDPELNAQAQRAIGKASPVIAYPSYAEEVRVLEHYSIGTPAPERYRHLRAGVASGVRFEIAPVDLGALDINAAWDARAGRLVPSQGALLNTGEDQRWMLEFCRTAGLKPQFTTFDTLHVQSLRNVIDWGWVGSGPVIVKLFLAGAAATPATLLFYRERMRELLDGIELLWTPLVYGTDQFPLAALSLALGGHVRVGIGDHSYRERGEPTNAELVERIASIARAFGREPASPDEARALLALAPRAAAHA
jgi:uncharacterized protein (DUF849 family)